MKIFGLNLIIFVLLIAGCTNRDTTVAKEKLVGNDYRLFQDTPAWELAKAVKDKNIQKIKALASSDKNLLGYHESRFGETMLQLAVINENYESTKALLEMGADPNIQDHLNGDSPLMDAVSIGSRNRGLDERFLKLILKFGGDPNSIQHGISKTRFTPLMLACRFGNFDYVKILVGAGAKVNFFNEYGDSALGNAAIQEHPEITIYLIKNGADYKHVLYKTEPDKKDKYITDAMRYWIFDIGSEEYQQKMLIVDFLKQHGMDYSKAPIPEDVLQDHTKDFLEKY